MGPETLPFQPSLGGAEAAGAQVTWWFVGAGHASRNSEGVVHNRSVTPASLYADEGQSEGGQVIITHREARVARLEGGSLP